jgi:excinuclease ABC subunit C
MLVHATDLDFIITPSEKEALLLEYQLIQQYSPVYNIRLKDNKSYPYILMTCQDPFPGIYFSRVIEDKSTVIGPFVDSAKTRDLIDLITRIFKLRTCNNSKFQKHTACLYYYIDRCSAPCVFPAIHQEYAVWVKYALALLLGKRQPILRFLKKRMEWEAQHLNFEKAQKIKDDMETMVRFSVEFYLKKLKKSDYDVLVFETAADKSDGICLKIRSGLPHKTEYFEFNSLPDAEYQLKDQLLLQYYRHRPLPSQIILQSEPFNKNSIETVLRKLKKSGVSLIVPKQGNKKKHLELCRDLLFRYLQQQNYQDLALAIKSMLQLSKIPMVIEAYDISHLNERQRVGAMVTFSAGKPKKSLYRNYRIRSALSGDTEALREVLKRRLSGKILLPDLILIDGGIAQLQVGLQIVSELHLHLDLVALAKKEERIFFSDGKSLLLLPGSRERFLFQSIRDEVHRRAISFHKKLREKIF